MEVVRSSLTLVVLPRCSRVAGLVTQVSPTQAVAPCYQAAGDPDPGWVDVVMAPATPCWSDLMARGWVIRPRWAIDKAAVKEVLAALLTACFRGSAANSGRCRVMCFEGAVQWVRRCWLPILCC